MTAAGKITATRIVTELAGGRRVRVLLVKERAEDILDREPLLQVATRKTGVETLEVTEYRTRMTSGGWHRSSRQYRFLTSAGWTAWMAPAQTMWLAPEDPAGIKRAHVEALKEDQDRDQARQKDLEEWAQAEAYLAAAQKPTPEDLKEAAQETLGDVAQDILDHAEPEVTAKEALAAIGGCWAGGALTGKALGAYERGDYALAYRVAQDQKALQEKGGPEAIHPEHRGDSRLKEPTGELGAVADREAEEAEVQDPASCLAVGTRVGRAIWVAPLDGPTRPTAEDLSDLAQALAAEDLEHPDPEEEVAPAQPRCVAGDVVTIHRGVRLYEVLQVAPDSAWDRIRGERVDHTMARVAPCDPEDHRDPQWVHVDFLHVQGPVARLQTVESRADRRVRYTQEVVKTPDGALRRPALMLSDPQRQPSAHLMPADSNWDAAPPITLRHGDAITLDGRTFRYVEGALEPARWRDRLPVS